MHKVSPLMGRTPTARPWYTHRWPWLLMLGPMVVIVAGSYAGYLAFTRQDAMVVDDYYREGKAINQDLRRDRVATSLGLAFEARYDPAAGVVRGRLLGFGRPVHGTVSLYLAHSTQPAKDVRLLATLGEDGAFQASLPLLERGRWQLVVEGARRDWRLAGSWKWPQQQTVSLRADPAVVQ